MPGLRIPQELMMPARCWCQFWGSCQHWNSEYLVYDVFYKWTSLWLSGKESTCNIRAPGDMALIPGSGRSSGGGRSADYSIPAWKKIPWTEESGGLQSMGLQRFTHDWLPKHKVQMPYKYYFTFSVERNSIWNVYSSAGWSLYQSTFKSKFHFFLYR